MNQIRQALLDAIQKVLSGELYLSPRIQKRLNEGYRSSALKPTGAISIDKLSRRERAIIKLVAEGKRNREIAESLSLSERTIEKYRSDILKKLDLSRTSELIKYALKHGIA